MNSQQEFADHKVDGINLSAICREANWHLATAIEKMRAAGLSNDDAQSFAAYVFHDHADMNGGRVEGRAEDHLSEEQWQRLS